MTFDLLK